MVDDLASFVGGVQRSGPLQSGLQQLDWLTYRTGERRSLPNVAWVVTVPDGLGDDDVTAAVSALVRRHETLRTSFDADADGRPRQNVHEDVRLTFAPVDDEESRRTFVEHPFDVATRPPFRFGRMPDGNLIFSIAHIAIDGMGAWTLVSELDELLAARRERRTPDLAANVSQPVDHALDERGPRRPRAESSLRYWDSTLRDFPVTILPVGRGRPGADVVRTDLDSRAASLALTRLQQTLGATPASIFTAAAYTALAVQFGRDRLGLNLTWSFRELPTTRRLVAAVFRDMPLLLDLAGRPSFTEVLRRLRKAILLSGRHMGFDVLEFHECAGRVEAERGAYLPGPEVISITVDGEELELAKPGVDLRAALAETQVSSYRTNESWDVCNVYVGASPVERRLLIDARLDGSVLGEHDSEALARLIEAVLVHAAVSGDLTFDAAEALATRTSLPGARSAQVGDVRVDLDFLSELLEEHPSVRRADVSVGDGRLTAEVDADLEPWQLRDFLLSTDNGRTAVLTPEHFVVHRADGRTVAGSGIDRPALAPEGAAERAFRDAVAEANGLTEVTMAGTYLTVGGRIHLAPRVLSLLRDAGFEGVTLADLRRPTSLVALTGRVQRCASPLVPVPS